MTDVASQYGVWWVRQGEAMTDPLHTNIQHRIVHHSPTGMNVGYTGSGVSDFALNIINTRLEMLGYDGQQTNTCFHKAIYFQDSKSIYHDFKRDYLANGELAMQGQITWDEIDMWLSHCESEPIRTFMLNLERS